MKLADFALRNDKVILFAVVVLAVLGVRAYIDTPQSIFPTMSFSRIDVVADAGDLPPEQVRIAVARPLEQAFQALPSVTSVLSTSSQGSAELIVEFAPSTDPRVDLQYVDQAVSQIRSSLSAIHNVVSVVINPNSEPVLSYALTSQALSPALLRQIVELSMIPKLYGVTGMGRLLVTGGPVTEFHVELDPAALAAHGVGAAAVASAISDANNVQAVGVAQRFYQRYAIVVDSQVHDVGSLQRLMIPLRNGVSVPLSALGTVSLGVGPLTDEVSINGDHAVMLNAYPLPGADTVKMAAEFRARLARVEPQLPRDVKVTNFWDQTTLIVQSQAALRDAIVLGAILSVFVIYLFLRNWRLTLVAAAVIPIAMAIAVFALGAAGHTLNLMSVGGLAVAVGLIIDDAIVVIENISRHRREQPDLSKDHIVRGAMSQISGAMIASTASTVVVFAPLALLAGVTGFFFRSLAFTLSAALIVSLGLALFVAPTIARALLHEGPERRQHSFIDGVLARYEPLLRWALGHRPFIYVGAAGMFVATVLLLATRPSNFLPTMDEGQFEIGYALPTGTTLAASDAAARAMEAIVRSDPAVASVGGLTGVDSNGYSPTPANDGLLRVRLVPLGQRSDYPAVSERLRARLQAAVPAATFDFHQILEDLIDGLSGTKAPVEIVVHGTDQATLIALANRVTAAISHVPGVVDAYDGITYVDPSFRIAPRGAQLAALGITPADVGNAVAALAQGTVATSVATNAQLVPVRVAIAGAGVAGGDLAATPLLANGSATSLGDVAALQTVRLASNIDAENGQPLVRVTANISGAALSSVTGGIKRALRGVAFPPGYSFDVGGQAQTQAQSFSGFASVIAMAVVLVFAVILATFGSLRLPLVILMTIPLSLIGVALALTLTQTAVNVSSFMGLLMLVGLVVKNGILFIDVANKQRAQGADIEEALVAAGRTRLRPIVMTTLAAIGGLVPLAIGVGAGAAMEKPLAIAVIGGLATATIFTLIIIPVLYAAFAGKAAPARTTAVLAA